MTAINLPSLSFNIDESSDKETLNNILDTLQLYRKELNFLLMNLDEDNMPSVIGRIEDGEGNISNISQTVDEISMTVSSNAGDISNLQIKADQISAKVANAQGDIAALVITANGISSTVASHTGQISQINQTASGIQTQVSNQAGQISSLSQTASSIQTQVTNNKGEISTVKQTASGLQTQVSNNKNDISTVTQTVNGIRSQVSSLDREVGGFYSEITQLSGQISSKVGYNDYNGREIASLINQEAHRITISAEAIDLHGITTVNGQLRIGTQSDRNTYIRFGGGPTIYGEVRSGFGAFLEFSATDIDFGGANIRNFKGGSDSAIEAYYSSNKCYLDLGSRGLVVRDTRGGVVGTIPIP